MMDEWTRGVTPQPTIKHPKPPKSVIPYYRPIRSADYNQRAEKIKACLEHKVASTSDAWAYNGSVSRDPNPRAHGNVGYTDTCVCGAERKTLVNREFVEIGPWYTPKQ